MATLEATIPAAGAAVDQDTIIGECPFDGTVSVVELLPEAAVTGATATARTFNVINKGLTGVGTTVIATLALITSNNMVAYDAKPFVLSAVAGALNVAKGDVLTLDETHASTGTAHTGGILRVDITPRNV